MMRGMTSSRSALLRRPVGKQRRGTSREGRGVGDALVAAERYSREKIRIIKDMDRSSFAINRCPRS